MKPVIPTDADVIKAVERAQTWMLLKHSPFFAHLALKLKIKPTMAVNTAGVDGTYLYLNAEFVNNLSDDHFIGVMAHEVLHCALKHPYRYFGPEYDHELMNIACDEVINKMVKKAGFKLPGYAIAYPYLSGEGHVDSPEFEGMSEIEVYHILLSRQNKSRQKVSPPRGCLTGEVKPAPKNDSEGGQKEQNRGKSDPSETVIPERGENGSEERQTPGKRASKGSQDKDSQPLPNGSQGNGYGDHAGGYAGESDEHRMSEQDWEIAVEQARRSTARTKPIFDGLDRLLRTSQVEVDEFDDALRHFMEKTRVSYQSWDRPSRRLQAVGIYAPGKVREGIGKIVVGFDTSGSTIDMVKEFGDKLNGLLHDYRPETIEIIYCDSRIHGTQTFQSDDPEINLELDLTGGGGGTDFRPVFEEIDDEVEKPVCMLFFTDLEGPAPEQAPTEYPVLWVVPERKKNNVHPWGDKVVLKPEKRK